MSAITVSKSTKDIFIAALSLPVKSRAELVHKLLISLEEYSESPEVQAAWDDEASRRYEAFQQGKLKARNTDEVFRRAYKKLK